MRFLFTLLLLPLFSIAQDQLSLDYYLPNYSNYNSQIPTPESVIGHQVGEWHVSHDKLVQYMYTLADESDRISIKERGTTYEGRPLVLLTITSPENHRNIKSIQQNHIDATNGKVVGVDRPIVVYQGFSIHGNEASGSNASLLLAYHLAASNSNETLKQLDSTVILFDPSLNPDGLQRFSNWVNANKNMHLNPDPYDREYNEVWPGGRTNHYWFDMNRDWLPVQLPESRIRIKTFHNWLPNILTDHHEMGTNATFFFQPGIPSRTHPLTPLLNQKLTEQIGKYHASALDEIGSLYYSKESFDDFYYGKGSTFPDINGSIGILFEQSSSRGHIQESANGILTFPFTIRNQLTAGLSTLNAAYNMREQILEYQFNFFNDNLQKAQKERSSAIVFGDATDAARGYHLAEILMRHNIKVHELSSDQIIEGKAYKKGAAYVVPKNQKNRALIEAMFETRTEFQDSLFYDISAWTLPMAFNMDYNKDVKIQVAGNHIKMATIPVPQDVNYSPYAYLMSWGDYYSPKALHEIGTAGIRTKVAMKPFTVSNQQYDFGTILIPVQNQNKSKKELHEFLQSVSQKAHVNIQGVSSGLTQGPDLGSNNFRTVRMPKIALIVGRGISSYDAGELWHLLDARYEIPVTKLDLAQLGRADLSRYTTIIIPKTRDLFSDDFATPIKEWVKDGGTLIAYQNALRWVDKNNLMEVEFEQESLTATGIRFEQRRNFTGAQGIGGAIFEVALDRSHPVNFGIKNDQMPVFKNNTLFVTPDKNSYNNPIQYTKSPLLSGYISEEKLALLKETVSFKSKSLGRGIVIGFTDNANFRAFWYGTNKLLANSLFFSSEM
jgi:hypothetical protein